MNLKKVMMILTRTLVVIVLICGLLISAVSFAKEKPKFTVVIRMMDIQDKWFRSNIIEPFEKEYNVDIKVAVFDKMWDVPKLLELDAQKDKPTINLVKTPKEIMLYLKKKDLIQPYDDIVPAHELKAAKADYDKTALEVLGILDGKLYFIPRKLETRMTIYLKSKVKDVRENWTKLQAEINETLEVDNGYGLPAGYTLETDPNQWDLYDLFVVSYYWAHIPYFGMKMPRMAHRGQKYMGTVTGLADKAVEMGATQEDLLKLDSMPLVDMFQWEAIFRKNGLYNSGMWEEAWSGGGIWGALRDGKVFLAFMHQIDCFFIHGGTHPMMAGYLAEPDDLGAAVMPFGVSFDLDKNGKSLRTGNRKAETGGWGWGVPKNAPYPELAWKLARYITNYQNHLAECQTFGMFPIREDIVTAIKKVFPIAWMSEVFEISVKQARLNAGFTAPIIVQWTDVGKVYLDAWYDLIVDKGYESTLKPGKVDKSKITSVLKLKYAPRVNEILK